MVVDLQPFVQTHLLLELVVKTCILIPVQLSICLVIIFHVLNQVFAVDLRIVVDLLVLDVVDDLLVPLYHLVCFVALKVVILVFTLIKGEFCSKTPEIYLREKHVPL